MDNILGIIGMILLAIFVAIVARRRGFNPRLWAFAGWFPILGIPLVFLLPKATLQTADGMKNRSRGNIVGGILSLIGLVSFIYQFISEWFFAS